MLLDAFATPDPPDTPDEQQRTPTQRRHDAFSAMLHTLLAQPGLPTVQGARPHILLTIDLAALLGLPCDHPVAGTTLTDLAERLGFDLASHGLTLGVSTDSDSADATQTDYGAPADHGAPAGTGDNARDDVSSPVQQRARPAGPQANPNDIPQPPQPSVDCPRAGTAPDPPRAGPAPDSPPAGPAPDSPGVGTAPDPTATPPPRRPARFGSGQPANPALVRGLLPAATIMAVLTLGPWRAVNVGSVHRTLPAWLRTVLLAMHQHCRGPDCDRPATWTQAHHITPWATSRTTDLNDTLPLCAAHHKLIDKGWTATLDHATGNATWTAPTGRTIIVPPP